VREQKTHKDPQKRNNRCRLNSNFDILAGGQSF